VNSTLGYEFFGQSPERTQPHNRWARTLEAARLLHSTLDLRQLTRIILEIIRNEVPVDRVTAFVVDHKRGLIHSLVAQGLDEQTISFPIGKGIAGFVAQTRQALDIPDAYADPRFNKEFDKELQYRTNDILALPVLNNGGDVIGVLELLNRKKAITEQDTEFLQDVSVFIGMALENAWLHEEVRNKALIEKELIQSRERLAQLERFSLMTEVLSTVAREVKGPLNIVRNHAAKLREDPNLNPRSHKYVSVLEQAAETSADAISGFLDFVQKPIGERAAVNVTRLVRRIIDLRTANWSSDGIVSKEELGATPAVFANAEEIEQAVMNLIKNAEDAMSTNNGPRTLTIRTDYDPRRKMACIRVGDSGPGIVGRHYDRIFEPFFSTKREKGRTGLGLTIANRIIQEHQGEILFETNSDGSVFTIELPVMQQQ
jgi:signal transduction histidine kinase